MGYAIAYVRVSTEEQTVLNQKMAIQRWATRQGYQIVYYFEDSSGKKTRLSRHAGTH
jgi:putative DNA-invertase from lambdoid prophage Rac